MDVIEQFQQRYGTLLEPERQRLLQHDGMDCLKPSRYQPWEIVRTVQGFEEDELSLRAWIHEGVAEEVRPILCGYHALLRELAADRSEATERARSILRHSLSMGCSMLAQYWIERLFTRAQRHGADGEDSLGLLH